MALLNHDSKISGTIFETISVAVDNQGRGAISSVPNSSHAAYFEGRIFQIHSIRRENEERWFLNIDAEEGVGS